MLPCSAKSPWDEGPVFIQAFAFGVFSRRAWPESVQVPTPHVFSGKAVGEDQASEMWALDLCEECTWEKWMKLGADVQGIGEASLQPGPRPIGPLPPSALPSLQERREWGASTPGDSGLEDPSPSSQPLV